jgi:hypothetical protein
LAHKEFVGRQNAGVGGGSRAGGWLFARALACCVSFSCALSCATTDDESGKVPREQCQDFEAGYCAKYAACALSTDRAEARESCDFSYRVYFPCDRVSSVPGTTQACLDAIDALSCDASSFQTTPFACQMLFGVQ